MLTSISVDVEHLGPDQLPAGVVVAWYAPAASQVPNQRENDTSGGRRAARPPACAA
jgi:hypothetical protein